MRKTKIICTLGPSTDDETMLEKMMLAGMNVARLNFSHGSYEEHKKRMDSVKKIREKHGLPVPIMLDTKGPEIRIKTFKESPVTIEKGQKFTFTTEEVEGDNTIVSITYESLLKDISRGNRILVDDGLVGFKVDDITDKEIICTALNDGVLSNRKSINIPGVPVKMNYMSEVDKEDIIFGIKEDVDVIAASFVRSAYDILEIRKVLEENGGQDIKIIAKIENNEGVNNIDEIIKVSDGIMVARGDMGVEIPLEQLPGIQKMLIKKCYTVGKVVITATQMLESMIKNTRPTRAETTDVANAIYDGTSGIMLSGETAVGNHPDLVVATMSLIAESTEKNINYEKRFSARENVFSPNVADAISHATCTTAHDLSATAIITVTKTGLTARTISKFRPACPIIATTVSKKAFRQMSLSWGVVPLMCEEKYTSDELFEHAVDIATQHGYVKNGDIVVITAGMPVGISGNTNVLKVHLVGHVLVEGSSVNDLNVSGKLCVAKDEGEALAEFCDGDILVINKTSNTLLKILKHASGIITEEDGSMSHGAIVGMTLNIPVITGAKGATTLLKTGTTVTMDSARGLVYSGVVKIM